MKICENWNLLGLKSTVQIFVLFVFCVLVSISQCDNL